MGNVLIFGATSAIAAEVARLYAARGDRLFLVGRDPEKLSSLVTSIGDRVVGHESCDLNELESNAGRVRQAIDALGGLDIALIAHGYLGDQVRSETEFEHARQVLSTNYLSALSLLMPLANFFESQGRGHLAAITSVAGERGRPRNYTYGSAKGGLTKYLQGMRSRMYRTDVWIHNLKLGPVDTPMTVDHEKHALFGEKKRVARGIVKATDSRRHVTYLPRVWALVMFVVRIVPEPIFQRFKFLAGR
jgi:short-subunit dehydrogenase